MWVNSYSKPQMKSAIVMPYTLSTDKLLPRQHIRKGKSIWTNINMINLDRTPITHPFTGVNRAGKTISSSENAKISF